jgi:sodium/proline symporter
MMSMHVYEVIAMALYFCILVTIGFFSYRRHVSASVFIIGGRSLNYWLTALAAHASDMSSWLFTAYPALILTTGLFGSWIAVGLIACMFINWQFIAPKIRVATEAYNALTFSSFFENRVLDRSGRIRIFSACILIFFYTIYISAGLLTLGLLLETLFDLPYWIGITIGIFIVIPYVFTGGYITLAWIDLFQGIFLMCAILFVPFYLMPRLGGWDAVMQTATSKHLTTSLFPDFSPTTIVNIVFTFLGWGLGYFGQPHIVTKFMGIRNVSEIPKSKYVGMVWMVLSLSAATLVGFLGISFFQQGLPDPEQVFIQMVRRLFHPFIIGLMLCAILAATINAMGSQVLVLSSSLANDLYKRIVRPHASSEELVFVSRLGILGIGAIAFLIAWGKWSSIFSLVQYAWSGIGASFGPLLIFSLYFKRLNRQGAWAGLLAGGITAAVWPYINTFFTPQIPSMITGYILSILAMVWASHHFREKSTAPAG